MDHSKPHSELYNIPWTTEKFNGMSYRLLGKSGLRVSNVGLGIRKVGYPETGDDSRVGAKLVFAYGIKEGYWHHTGKNSKGEPMYEIWAKR